jgi:ABC-2 type transport system ATP-binding protein
MGAAAIVIERAVAPLIRVRGFGKRYRGRPAVQDVDLTVRRGEIYGLIGPDGAGKSSLMKALAGVLTFEAGHVEVFGIPLTSDRAAEAIKDRTGFMPQGLGLNLYPELSVEENLDFFARLRLVPDAELTDRKERLLDMTRLGRFRDRAMKHLSGGMKQKLGLICTLIHTPELVILDEPTTGVDPVSRRDFWAILAELLQEQGITALVSTAYMDEASRFHRLALMHGGRVLAEGEPEAIRAQVPGTVVTVQTEDPGAALARLRPHFPDAQVSGAALRILTGEADALAASHRVRDLLADLVVGNLATGEPELEDVFVALLRREGLAGEAEGQGGRGGAGRFSSSRQPLCWVPSGIPLPLHAPSHADIEAKGLTRDFGAFRAVDRVSFRVRHGEIFGLLGANGAGKTTVIKMLTGILPPSSGQGQVAGVDMRRAGRDIKKRIGYVSQSFSLYQDLTVGENLHLYAGIYGLGGREARRRIGGILDMAGLEGREDELSGSLPMGMRQRLALGCALVHRPQVLFLDEPTSGVDPLGRRRFWEILFHLARAEGVAILITTHYMSEAEQCDRLALMYAGRIVADASPGEMKRQMATEAGRLLEVTAEPPSRALDGLQAAGFPDAALFGRQIHLLSRQVEADRQRIPAIIAAAGGRAEAIAERPLSMEDVFVYCVTALERQERAAAGEREG